MENFLLNFAAQIDVSRINISSSVRNTLAALTKGGTGGTTKVKQIVELDVRTVGKVSDLGSKIVDDLQKAVARVKVAPTAIISQKELGGVTGRLEQIPTLLKVINAQIKAIQAKPEIIPNAAENLTKLSNLKRSLSEIKSAADKAFKIQFSAELAPIRVLDAQINGSIRKIKDLQAQLETLKSTKGAPGQEVAAQTSKMFEAKAKIDALRAERRKAKSLSADEVAALKGQEKEALDKFVAAQEARRRAKPIGTQIKDLSEKEAGLKKPLFEAQKAYVEGQKAADSQLAAAKKKLELEQLGLETIKKQTAEIAAQNALSKKTAQKKLEPLQKSLSEAEAQKSAAGSRLQSIDDRRKQIIAKEQAAARKFLEVDYAKAEAEFKTKSAGVRSIKKREELKQQILGPLEERKLAAETALNFAGFQPKGKEFSDLTKKATAASTEFAAASTQEAAAKKALDLARQEIVEKAKSKAASKDLVDQQKKVEDAAKNVLEIEKKTAAEIAKLKGEYNALNSALENAQRKRAELEKRKQAGDTGLKKFDDKVLSAKKELDDIQSKLLVTGEDPKRNRAFVEARSELKAATEKRNAALQQQKTVDSEILAIETRIAAQKKLQNDLDDQRSKLAASLSGNLRQDVATRQKIIEIVDRTVAAETRLQKTISSAFAKSGKQYKPADGLDPEERAFRRLGITREDYLSPAPTKDLLEKVRIGSRSASKSREADLEKALSEVSAKQRGQLISDRFKIALGKLDEAQRREEQRAIANLPVDRREGARQASREQLARDKRKLAETLFGGKGVDPNQPGSVERASDVIGRDQVQSVNTLRRINEAIRQQNVERKASIEAERTIAKEEKNRLFVRNKIDELVREEAKNRGRIASQFAEKGLRFDPSTGLATRAVPAGATAPLPVRVAAAAGTPREAVLGRLGITEQQLAVGGPDIREKIKATEKQIQEQRRTELESARFTANRTVQTDKTILALRELIVRDLEIARRNARLTGAPAPTVGASASRVLGRTFGTGVTTLDQARTALSTASQADAVAAIERVNQARAAQRDELRRLSAAEAAAARTAREAAAAQARETQQRTQGIERLNRLIERSALLYERQIRATNSLARSGIPGVQAQPVDQTRLNTLARQTVLGGADPSTMSAAGVATLERDARRRLRSQEAALREFNSVVKDVASGTRSSFELISRYSDNAFDRFGARVGLASERLAAYVTSGAGIYTVIAATRQAILQTALLEKEITGIQQIFDQLDTREVFGGAVINSFDEASKKATDLKTLVLDLAQVTGQQPVELAQAAKTLAAAGFGAGGKPGFEQTIRAISFAGLGPSFGNSQEIIDGLIASVNQFNRSLEETPYILGLVNQFSKDYAVEAQDLFEAIKRGGGSFAAVGGNLEDFIKLVTVVREQTREAAPVIGTFLKTLSSRLFSARADKLLSGLGLDPQKLIDPYQRLLALAGEIEKRQAAGAAGNVKILSELIDVRQTGRLFSLLESLKKFDKEFAGQDIAAKATQSIVSDARKRLDDIGPTIDRIGVSYFKFIEGIYNNPATKALLDIPAGLLGALSEVPKAGFSIGKANFQAANFINPLAQGVAFGGIAAVIRGSISALQQNLASVRTNTVALDSLRTAVSGLAGRLGVTIPGQQGGQQPQGRGGGIFAALRGAGGANLAALGLATVIPGIINSVLPATNLEQDTQNVVSSAAQGGAQGLLISTVLGASLRTASAVGLAAAALSALAADSENVRKERQLRELEAQSLSAQTVTAFENAARQGLVGAPGKNTELKLPSKSAESFFKAIAQAQKIGFKDLNLLGSGYTAKDFTNDLLGVSKDQKETARQRLLLKLSDIEGFDPKEAEKGFEAAGERIREAVQRVFIQRLRTLEDTEANRRRVSREVASEFSQRVSVGGVKLDAKSVEKSLQGFLELDQETGKFSTTLSAFKLSIKSLYEESEIAARTLNILGATLSKVIETQNVGIQRVLDEARRQVPSVETTRRLITNPFTVQTTQALPQSASIATAVQTIKDLGQKAPVNLLSPEVLKISKIIDGFLNELSVSDSATREEIVRAFSDENLKKVGGFNQEAVDSSEESRASLQQLAVTNAVMVKQVEQSFGALSRLGASSSELFDIIKTSAPLGAQPFDLRELARAITSGETGAGLRIVGLQQAEQRIREQANLIIERNNFSIEQQIRATEALIATIIDARNSQLELAKANRDNQLSIVSLKSSLGLFSKEFAAELGLNIKETERINRGSPEDVSGIADTINIIKRAQNELNKVIQSVGQQGGANREARDRTNRLIEAANPGLRAFGLREISTSSSSARTAADLAGSRALLERQIQEVFANLQDKFRNLGETVDVIGSKIQSQRGALQGLIEKLFSGNIADQALAKTQLQAAQFNVEKIAAALKGIDPNLLAESTGPLEILKDTRVADAIAPIISSLSQRDLTGLREYLNIAGANALNAGGTGEQIKAAIEAAFAKILPTFGINVGQSDIASNINSAQLAIQKAAETARELNDASIEQARIMNDNVGLISGEVTLLSQAIAEIPKKIDLVISGINNVTVDFDLTKVNESVSKIGTQVYGQLLKTLGEAFRRANISIPEIGG